LIFRDLHRQNLPKKTTSEPIRAICPTHINVDKPCLKAPQAVRTRQNTAIWRIPLRQPRQTAIQVPRSIPLNLSPKHIPRFFAPLPIEVRFPVWFCRGETRPESTASA